MDESEVRDIAQSIVTKAKSTARVDQGTLKRSIAYTYIRGKVKFSQIYWGAFGDNSMLERLAGDFMPNGVEYSIVLKEFGGGIYEKGKTKQGRSTQKRALASTSIGNLAKTIALLNKRKKKNKDGNQEN